MGKELPSIFKNSTNKKIENNKRVFYSKYENIGNVVEVDKKVDEIKSDLNNVDTFNGALESLFKNNQFVFNVPVEIITNSGSISTKIVSKVDDHLLTSSGKIINLSDILSIKIKDV